MPRKLKPFTKEEHEEFGKIIGEVTSILSPYMENLWKGYGVNSKQAKILQRALHMIGGPLCNEMDKDWHKSVYANDCNMTDKDNPYYGSHKKFWMKP